MGKNVLSPRGRWLLVRPGGSPLWLPAPAGSDPAQQKGQRKPSKEEFQLGLSFHRVSSGQLLACPLPQLLPSGQPFWLLLLRQSAVCPARPCWHEDKTCYGKGMVLQRSLPKAQQPSWVTWRHEQPSGVSTPPKQVSPGHTADYLPLLWSPRSPSILSGLCLVPLWAPLFLLFHP